MQMQMLIINPPQVWLLSYDNLTLQLWYEEGLTFHNLHILVTIIY